MGRTQVYRERERAPAPNGQIRSSSGAQALRVCLINPRFDPSFYGFDFALPLLSGDKRCWTVTGALPLLAALVPAGWQVELLDENIEPIDFDDLHRFDVIGVTGMIVQRDRMLQILKEIQKHRAVIAVGGAYVSVDEAFFEGLCDVRFIGEAEQTWPAFLDDVAQGRPVQTRYEQADKSDMTKVPVPRYDLVKCHHYVMGSMQFSRGCPFLCEFCDIIVIFGRKPRMKTAEQVLAELDVLKKAGFRSCFVVDDNFIGNRNEAKKLLERVIEWQRRNGYPLQLATEASINLADYPDLVELMVQANFRQVFIGIESPRRESLQETRKIQNARGDGLVEKVKRIRDGGLVVTAGFIVGFDADDVSIFDEQEAFIKESGIGQAAVAILSPIPRTPLYARLEAEGRLEFGDPEVAFKPKQMSVDALRDGHTQLFRRLYTAEAFLSRVFDGYRSSPRFRARRALHEAAIGRRSAFAGSTMRLGATLAQALRLGWMLIRRSAILQLAPEYVRCYFRLNRPLGRDAMPLPQYLGLLIMHWHFFNMARRTEKASFGTVSPSQNGQHVRALQPRSALGRRREPMSAAGPLIEAEC